jgi:hypothetical protein
MRSMAGTPAFQAGAADGLADRVPAAHGVEARMTLNRVAAAPGLVDE